MPAGSNERLNERLCSLFLILLLTIWDAWAQAHVLPYRPPDWLLGIILLPWGEDAYSIIKYAPGKIKRLLTNSRNDKL